MVHQWQCRECKFTVWSSKQSELVDAVKSHLLSHYKHTVESDEFILTAKDTCILSHLSLYGELGKRLC